MEDTKILKAENLSLDNEELRPSLLIQFPAGENSYIVSYSDCSKDDKKDVWTLLYDADEYLACEMDKTVPHPLYEEWEQDGKFGIRGTVDKEVKEVMDKELTGGILKLADEMGYKYLYPTLDSHEGPFSTEIGRDTEGNPLKLYSLSFSFDMPMARNQYLETKTEALGLDVKCPEPYKNERGELVVEELYFDDKNKCVEGGRLLADFAKFAELEKMGIEPNKYEVDIDNYEAEYQFSRSNNMDSGWTKSGVTCYHGIDIDQNNNEQDKSAIHLIVSIDGKDREKVNEEIQYLYKKAKEYARTSLVHENTAVFSKDEAKQLEEADKIIKKVNGREEKSGLQKTALKVKKEKKLLAQEVEQSR